MKFQNLLYKELSYQIQGAAIEVRKSFGPGHKESIYQKAFAEELKSRDIRFEQEKSIKIFSPKTGKAIGYYKPDFIVDDKIIIELKALDPMPRKFIDQLYDYLRNSKYELGYFINFASNKLYTKRIIFTNERKPFFKKLLVVLSLVLVVFSVPIVGRAQVPISLNVAPHTFDLQVLPGEELQNKIRIYNQSEVAIPIQVRVVNFEAAGEGGAIAFVESEEDISFNPRKWIRIENPNFILDPNESEKVNFSLNIPENAEPGSHYATVIFEPKLPSFYFEEEGVRTIPEIGVLFLISVKKFVLEPEIEQKLSIVEFSLPKEGRITGLENFVSRLVGSVAQAASLNIVESPPSKFTLRIKNNDIYHIKPFGKVLIYNFFGKKVGETEIPQRTILPGKIRQFPVEFSPEIPEKLKWLPASISNFLVQNFFVGKYQAKLALEAKSPLSAEILKPETRSILAFFSLPWKFWLVFILIFGMTIFLTIKYRKRIALAFKTLIRKPTEARPL